MTQLIRKTMMGDRRLGYVDEDGRIMRTSPLRGTFEAGHLAKDGTVYEKGRRKPIEIGVATKAGAYKRRTRMVGMQTWGQVLANGDVLCRSLQQPFAMGKMSLIGRAEAMRSPQEAAAAALLLIIRQHEKDN